MTGLLRRAWYLALGMAAAWAWHRIQRAGEAGPRMVNMSVPADLFPAGRVEGLAVTVEAAIAGAAGVDPATGLPDYGDPDDAPEGEQ